MQLLPRWHTLIILVQSFGFFEREFLLVRNDLFGYETNEMGCDRRRLSAVLTLFNGVFAPFEST